MSQYIRAQEATIALGNGKRRRMNEFIYGARHATELLDQVRRLDDTALATGGCSNPSEICNRLATSDDQVVSLDSRIQAIMRLKNRRASDWLSFLIDINAIFCQRKSSLRTSSVVLSGPVDWMAWIAPPDDLRLRTLDVISSLLARPFKRANGLAIFPALILVHPFLDGNGRAAIVFMEAVNRCYPVFSPKELDSFCDYIRRNQKSVIEVITQIRISGDSRNYFNLAISALCAQGSSNLGV